MSNRTKPFEIAPPDPGLKPGGIRMRALGSPEKIREVEIEMRRREARRQEQIQRRQECAS